MKSPRFRTVSLCVALCALCVPAWSCRRVKPVGAREDPVPAAAYPDVQLEKKLKRWMVVDYEGIVFERGTGVQPAVVTVPIRSVSRKPLRVQYRVLWFDDAGREIEASAWKFASLDPSARAQFGANSITSYPVDWRMEVRVSR